MKNKIVISLIAMGILANADNFYYENGNIIEVSEISQPRDNSGIKYYRSSKGTKIGVKNDLLVECVEDINCSAVLSKYETTSVKNLTDTIYLITIDSSKNIFEFSQKLYLDKKIKIAHPNFRKEKKRR
ncbi:hypothetical protein MNB_SV-15-1517 [hydrothermal vent metagenome]|uniref:Uncharacterized protein n=1 Tax=hydrothermal vent metagenome TaxID=652676 RepID=A0A1W1EHH2_9ZZZZ